MLLIYFSEPKVMSSDYLFTIAISCKPKVFLLHARVQSKAEIPALPNSGTKKCVLTKTISQLFIE